MPRRKDAHWFIEQRPCPGADPADLLRLVSYVMVHMATDMVRGEPTWAKSIGMALKPLDDYRAKLPASRGIILGDRFRGLIDEDGAEPDGEG